MDKIRFTTRLPTTMITHMRVIAAREGISLENLFVRMASRFLRDQAALREANGAPSDACSLCGGVHPDYRHYAEIRAELRAPSRKPRSARR